MDDKEKLAELESQLQEAKAKIAEAEALRKEIENAKAEKSKIEESLRRSNKKIEEFRKLAKNQPEKQEEEFKIDIEKDDEESTPKVEYRIPKEVEDFIKEAKLEKETNSILKKTGLNSLEDVKKVYGDNFDFIKHTPQEILDSYKEKIMQSDPHIKGLYFTPSAKTRTVVNEQPTTWDWQSVQNLVKKASEKK